MAAGELKHRPLAFLEKNVAAFVINPDDRTYNDTLSSAQEVKVRAAKMIDISNALNVVYDATIEVLKLGYALIYPWSRLSHCSTTSALTSIAIWRNPSPSGKVYSLQALISKLTIDGRHS